jgi:hypothetical protein
MDPSQHPRHLSMVRTHIAHLIASVNASRSSSELIADSEIDRVSEWLMEEFLVRIETQVYRLMRDSDAIVRDSRPYVRFMTSPDLLFPRGDVYDYLFEFNSVFRPTDRTALTAYEHGMIGDLFTFFRDRVDYFIRLRYSDVIHGPGFRGARPAVDIGPTLPHRSFIPEISRSVDEAGH